jgi:hypothetical protein
MSNQTHFINAHGRPGKGFVNGPDLLLILTGHWGHYFQHFFDNIGPQLAISLDVLGLSPSSMSLMAEISPLFKNVPKLWERIGFPEVIPARSFTYGKGKLVAMVESAPRIHPHFFDKLRSLLKLPLHSNPPEKIIWVSRGPSNSYYSQRFILNEADVVARLEEEFGESFVVFSHILFSLNETIELFSDAKCIIGSHGGGLYNQFFSPKETVIVEIMPVKRNGLYADQKNARDVPTFSHMAVWSNSLLIGQKFWRYYEFSDSGNYNVRIGKLLAFLKGIPELEICEVPL